MSLSSLLSQRVSLSLKINFPSEVVEEYEAQAREAGIHLDELLARRLTASIRYTSNKPLYFTDDQRRELEKLLGRNFDTPMEAISEIRRSNSIEVNGTEITLLPRLLQRLKTRCFGKQSFSTFLKDRVIAGLEEFAGIR